ncbi:hypothetical protein [Vibrio mediterranei]|uniref:Uncharacterized protein n=1 Tax=Vibrio mediterranei TaxID=689 RepID=A0ABX5D684_9VIBR|nr:hypothetical protein [Vibrio mediterranei]PRQ65157.1 hypothetical protein COR51_23845 [Vibrio mediterranei]
MSEVHCPLSISQPLFDALCRTQRERLSDDESACEDIEILTLALTRFMHNRSPYHSFDDDSQSILDVLERHVSGCFSKESGSVWHPGMPMHLDHLVNAIMGLVEG